MQDKLKSVLDINSASSASENVRSMTMVAFHEYKRSVSTRMAKVFKHSGALGSADPASDFDSMDSGDDGDDSADDTDDGGTVFGPAAAAQAAVSLADEAVGACFGGGRFDKRQESS